jgi:integrase
MRITPEGAKPGQEVKRLGWADELTSRAKREGAKQAIMAEINSGRSFATAQIPLSFLIDKYRSGRLPQLASTTQKKYENHLDKHIEPDLGNLQLFEIEPSLLQTWLNKKTCWSGLVAKRVERPMGSATKQDILHVLSALFDQARKWRMYQGANPCQDVELGRMEPVRQKYLLSERQTRNLLDALECCPSVTQGVTGVDVALMVRVVIASGWRISEVLGLQRDAIDGEVLELRRRWSRGNLSQLAKSKAGFRKNFVGPLAAELLARPGGFIFTEAGGQPPDDRNLIQHILRPCAAALKCYREGFGFHSFRRLNITWRQEAGAKPFEAMILAGHSKPSTTMDYTVVDEKRERAQVKKMMRRIQ